MSAQPFDRFTCEQLDAMHIDAYQTVTRLAARVRVITDAIRQCPLDEDGDIMAAILEEESRPLLAAIREQEELAHAISEHLRDRNARNA